MLISKLYIIWFLLRISQLSQSVKVEVRACGGEGCAPREEVLRVLKNMELWVVIKESISVSEAVMKYLQIPAVGKLALVILLLLMSVLVVL